MPSAPICLSVQIRLKPTLRTAWKKKTNHNSSIYSVSGRRGRTCIFIDREDEKGRRNSKLTWWLKASASFYYCLMGPPSPHPNLFLLRHISDAAFQTQWAVDSGQSFSVNELLGELIFLEFSIPTEPQSFVLGNV